MHSAETDGDKSRRNDFVLGDWTVAPSRNLLIRGGEEVRVEPRVMDVLVCLAERTDRIVSKRAGRGTSKRFRAAATDWSRR